MKKLNLTSYYESIKNNINRYFISDNKKLKKTYLTLKYCQHYCINYIERNKSTIHTFIFTYWYNMQCKHTSCYILNTFFYIHIITQFSILVVKEYTINCVKCELQFLHSEVFIINQHIISVYFYRRYNYFSKIHKKKLYCSE